MHVRFLLGPAGSGKTFRCVEEVRSELLRAPDGPELVFLAPKQATFQIERQLLGDGGRPHEAGNGNSLRGYSRLHILSFERLAVFVFDQLGLPLPELLNEESRVMVLRALLARHHSELRTFRASARLTGFASQLSLLLRELQRSRVRPESLSALASRLPAKGRLNDKLHDLALLLDRYEAWLATSRSGGQPLKDASRLLDLATDALNHAASAGRNLKLGGLWLDGFAEMTPQETALLAALAGHCDHATLAFCLDGEPHGELSWLSPWTVVARSFNNCRQALARSLKIDPQIETLPREPNRSRFAAAPELAGIERAWVNGLERGQPCPPAHESGTAADKAVRAPSVRLVACPNTEAEATLAAREILRHVQVGGRFRECAVLVRSLDGYHDVLRRVFTSYEIPFFLDRREPVAHHPLAELTRYALRTVTFDWRKEDWFGALKTGLAGAQDEEVDWLENEALKRGWEGSAWHESLAAADDAQLTARLEQIRQRILPPFAQFATGLQESNAAVTGGRLAIAVRGLWSALEVENQLEAWAETAAEFNISGAIHGTVWTQLNEWLDGLELAFADEALSLREWLPILEAGLAGMTVGVIPPSLDQVLIGSVDRSRNPDLQIAFVLGVNEGVFPAPPEPGVLLTDSDRSELEAHGVVLGASQRQRLGHERYFGYIAFTRARRQIVITWATADAEGEALNPSSFVTAIKRAVPAIAEETFCAPPWTDALHKVELPEHVLAACRSGLTPVAGNGVETLAALPEFSEVIQRWKQARDAVAASQLSAEAAEQLYGKVLSTSVSALEDFSACPFRFLAARGLRAQEREEFVADAREKGSFQHEVLQKFHEHVRAENRQWRDLAPDEARRIVREIGAETVKTFRGGLMNASAASRFTAAVLINNLEQLMETLVGWAQHYCFDPVAVEVSFGLDDPRLPAWEIQLSEGRALKLRGRIDRVDLCRAADGEALLVICDYKSGGKQMDPVKIENGLELQLLSYLAALTQMPEAGVLLGAERLDPAGVFYVPLRARVGSAKTRLQAAQSRADAAIAFQHRGRFDGGLLAQFDNRGGAKGEQFRFKLNNGGAFAKVGNEALQAGEFPALVADAEAKLRAIGERIFRGEAAVSPYRLKQQTACDLCAYRAVCRFDSWTMSFRKLGKPDARQAEPRMDTNGHQ